jgi:uncharacterized protein DUF4180
VVEPADISIATVGEGRIIEGPPGVALLHSANDIVDVIGICFEHRTLLMLLYAENLPERFFDLSSGDAGTILQKLRNYHIKLAVVVPPGGVAQSSRFGEMVLEERRSGYFHIFEDRELAEAWLVGG